MNKRKEGMKEGRKEGSSTICILLKNEKNNHTEKRPPQKTQLQQFFLFTLQGKNSPLP
jgi:hypothetical protein